MGPAAHQRRCRHARWGLPVRGDQPLPAQQHAGVPAHGLFRRAADHGAGRAHGAELAGAVPGQDRRRRLARRALPGPVRGPVGTTAEGEASGRLVRPSPGDPGLAVQHDAVDPGRRECTPRRGQPSPCVAAARGVDIGSGAGRVPGERPCEGRRPREHGLPPGLAEPVAAGMGPSRATRKRGRESVRQLRNGQGQRPGQ